MVRVGIVAVVPDIEEGPINKLVMALRLSCHRFLN